MNAWEQIKQSLSEKIPSEAFQNWFTETKLQQAHGDSISVAVPNEATKNWMEREYAESVRAVIVDLKLPIRRVQFEISTESINFNGHTDGTPIGAEPLFQ